tara:strand:- start:1453 stop:2133 length:681 start_codon:yes stop_codon:yes gene_type:complete
VVLPVSLSASIKIRRLFNSPLTNVKNLLLMVLLLPALARAEPVVLIVGDSISAGFGIPVQQGWVALMQNALEQDVPQLKIVNASISGDTTVGGRNRLPDLLSEHKPQLMILELGGNDALRGMPLQNIRKNLQSMVKSAQQAGTDVILLGMQIPPNYGARYTEGFRKLYQEVSEAENIPLVPFVQAEFILQDGMLQDDGIHPTEKAQPLIMKPVLEAVQQWRSSASQ